MDPIQYYAFAALIFMVLGAVIKVRRPIIRSIIFFIAAVFFTMWFLYWLTSMVVPEVR